MNLRDVVNKKRAELNDGVTRIIINGVKNYDEYRFQLGILRGIAELWQDIEPLLRDPDAIEDDNEE